MKKILFLTNLIPYPLDNGGKIKSYNTVKALSQNYSIDMICFCNEEYEKKHIKNISEIVDEIEVIPKTVIRSASLKVFLYDYIKSLFSLKPYNIYKFFDKRFKKALIKKLKENEYEFIYVDHLPMMVYQKKIKDQKVILDQHNVESLIFKRMIMNSENLVKKILGYFEYIKLKEFERSSLLKSNHVICLSEDDRKELLKLGLSKNKISVLPIHLTVYKNYEYKKVTNDVFNILFLGSMSWYPNQQGIKWFMEQVWPNISKDRFKIYIVGSNPPDIIKKYHDNRNVFVTGYVENVDEYISKCNISIVPLFVGSGQRVKIIESFAKKIPVISTSIGAEGIKHTSGKDLIIANDQTEFVNSLLYYSENLNELKVISDNAFNNFGTNYSAEKLPQKLELIIKYL